MLTGETERGPCLSWAQLESYTHLIALIGLVIRYRSGPAPVPVPVPVSRSLLFQLPTEAYDEDLRWRMVYQYCALELTYREIASNLHVDPSTVQRVVQRFEQSGTVTKDAYPKGHNHPSQILTEVDELFIIHLVLVLGRPSIYLREIQQELAETTGTAVSVPTLCDFLHKNGFSRKELSKVALQKVRRG